jgi:hypothetical protein
VLGRRRGQADQGPTPADGLLLACQNAKGTTGISWAECDRFADMVATAIGANNVATDAQCAAAIRELTPAEQANVTILMLTIGGYARLLAERRMTLDAFHQAVAMSLGVAARFDGYPPR